MLLEQMKDPSFFKLEDEVANEIVRRLTTYPSPSGKPQPFKSDKQRRWFFAALKSGAITVPYRRTQTLAKGWKIVTKTTGYTIENTVPYAPLVQGAVKDQAKYHQRWWESSSKVAQDVDKTIVPQLDRSAQKILDAMMSRVIPESPV